jgi:hypothetical protein
LAEEEVIEIYDRHLNQKITLSNFDYWFIEYRDAGYIIASSIDYDKCEYHDIYFTKNGFKAGTFKGFEVNKPIHFNEDSFIFHFKENAIDENEKSESVVFIDFNKNYKKEIKVNDKVEFNIGENPNFVQIDGDLYDFREKLVQTVMECGKGKVKYQCFEENPDNTDSIYTYDKSFFIIQEIDGIPDTMVKYNKKGKKEKYYSFKEKESNLHLKNSRAYQGNLEFLQLDKDIPTALSIDYVGKRIEYEVIKEIICEKVYY